MSGMKTLHGCADELQAAPWRVAAICNDGVLDPWEVALGGGILLVVLAAIGGLVWLLVRRRRRLFEEFED